MDSNNIYSAPVLGTAFTHRKLKGYKKAAKRK